MSKLIDWFLDPAKRKALYGALSAVGVLLVTFGVANDSLVTGAVGTVVAILNAAALVLASWKAQRADWTAIYGALAAIVTTLKVAGWISDGQASHVMDILAAGIAVLPLLAAFVRTTPATPTGEPQAEYLAKHASVPLDLVEPGREE